MISETQKNAALAALDAARRSEEQLKIAYRLLYADMNRIVIAAGLLGLLAVVGWVLFLTAAR